jgi:tetratricopeptide (TPR) repeat protein
MTIEEIEEKKAAVRPFHRKGLHHDVGQLLRKYLQELLPSHFSQDFTKEKNDDFTAITLKEKESLPEPDQDFLLWCLYFLAESLVASGHSHNVLSYIKQLLLLADNHVPDPSWEARALILTGIIYHDINEYSKSLEYYQMGLQASKEVNNNFLVSGVLSNIGDIYNTIADYHKALEYHKEALLLTESLEESYGEVATSLDAIATIYFHLSDYSKALEYYSRALAIEKGSGFPQQVGITLMHIGKVYYEQSNMTQALENYSQALKLFQDQNSQRHLPELHNSIGNVHKALIDYELALKHFHKALNISKNIGSKAEEAISLSNISNIVRSTH